MRPQCNKMVTLLHRGLGESWPPALAVYLSRLRTGSREAPLSPLPLTHGCQALALTIGDAETAGPSGDGSAGKWIGRVRSAGAQFFTVMAAESTAVLPVTPSNPARIPR